MVGGETAVIGVPVTAPLRPSPVTRGLVAVGLIVTLLYAVALVIYYLQDEKPEQKPDLQATDKPIVLLQMVEVQPNDHVVTARVELIPSKALLDDRTNVLTEDVAVRVYPSVELGELEFPRGDTPKAATTTLWAIGDPDNWPFDRYTADAVNVEMLVGSGSDRRYVDAELEVWGHIEGWIIEAKPELVLMASVDTATITMDRSGAALAFDLGICLVLISMPVLALFVAVETVRNRRRFLPPLTTWFAAMLFAVVPLRTILPGSPPAGAWVDQILVLWVLIALIVAMGIYIVAWWRQSD